MSFEPRRSAPFWLVIVTELFRVAIRHARAAPALNREGTPADNAPRTSRLVRDLSGSTCASAHYVLGTAKLAALPANSLSRPLPGFAVLGQAHRVSCRGSSRLACGHAMNHIPCRRSLLPRNPAAKGGLGLHGMAPPRRENDLVAIAKCNRCGASE